ncbi:alpha beta-hydrolase [Epithele typhae]|uniref:alpha beta-hydrolase n=1 Tax=Epithele typhae TaxID=378194 RepID=UPI00200892BC|nr:alpha beta-hydrolase [Epithele typhae]KAH9941670.1 alpha beta-hydrolase [Epithele typhae]
MRPLHYFLLPLLLSALSLASPPGYMSIPKFGSSPTVKLDEATVTGVRGNNVEKFLGIPFAAAPRFDLPQPIEAYTKSFTATKYGPACPQQAITLPLLFAKLDKWNVVRQIVDKVYTALVLKETSEDCLSLNVIAPRGAEKGDNLPVLAWIFGGGFEIGGSSQYDGTFIVQQSLEINNPVIFVSMNYRVSAYGFLAGKEVKDAHVGNLGLRDQRAALEWIQKYIQAFGGDPKKVTIWGQSAGAISASLHMLGSGDRNRNLFRGAIMQSGAPIPVGDIKNGQNDYNTLVKDTRCSKATDTLQCLRNVPFEALKRAVDNSPSFMTHQSLNLAWLPRVDGDFLEDEPQKMVAEGRVLDLPMISGSCEDEGSVFSLASRSLVATDEDALQYIRSTYMPHATRHEMDRLFELYPMMDVTRRNRRQRGVSSIVFPQQFQRIAAIQGDLVFQAPRRFFLKHRSGEQPTWAYRMSRTFTTMPNLGAFHGSDLVDLFPWTQRRILSGNVGGGYLATYSDLAPYFIHFAAELDPNSPVRDIAKWYPYTPELRRMLTFHDDGIEPITTRDDYRSDAMEFMTVLSRKYPM